MAAKTNDEYLIELKNKHETIIPLEKYISANTKIKHRCLKCGNEWNVKPSSLINAKHGCPWCARVRRTPEEYINILKTKKPQIEALEDYCGSHTKIKHKCVVCGYEWKIEPHMVLSPKRGCPLCNGKIIGPPPEYKNSIWSNSEHRKFYQPYLSEDQMKKYLPYSQQKLIIKCPDCGKEKEITLAQLRSSGLGCICSDGVSYPNKFVFNVLSQLHIHIKTEYCPKWDGKKRYDLFLPDYNIIIENHGLQHYIGWNKKGDVKQIQENDKKKYNTAIHHGINPEKYIVIDCKESYKNYIKKSIMNSNLPLLLNFSEDDIDWNKADIDSLKNTIKQVADLYNSGKSPREIIQILNSNKTIINRYLKRATILGWCNYDPNIERKIHHHKGADHHLAIPIYCVENNQVYSYIKQAATYFNINADLLKKCCERASHTSYKTPYHWHYLYDRIKQDGTIILGAITLGFITEEEALAQLSEQ